MPRAEQVTEPLAEHGEGPVWDSAGEQLLMVDLEGGALVRLDPGTGSVARHQVADVLAALRPRTGGGWVVAAERRFALLDAVPSGGADDGSPLAASMLAPLWERGRVRFNDGGCDPQGRFWAGSMAYDQQRGAGALWRLDTDGSAHRVLDDVTVSNGLAWVANSAAGSACHAYYVDSPTRRVDVLRTDPATGEVLGRSPFARLPEGVGDGVVPDGLTLDAEGGVWVALHGGSAVHRYAPDGSLSEVVDVGARQVTSCAFGGADLATLFVTTSQQGVDPAEDPGAGAVFAVLPGARGTLPLPYGG